MSVILVDLDGVVVDWTRQFEHDLAQFFPHLEFEALEEFKTPTHLSLAHQNAINFVKFRQDFYWDMLPIPGAIEGVKELAREHEVFFCSTPEPQNPTCASDKLDWVRNHFGEEWTHRVILTSDKTMVRGDILIDDRPDVVGAAIPEWEHVLFTQPYNAKVLDGRRRLNSWSDAPLLFTEATA